MNKSLKKILTLVITIVVVLVAVLFSSACDTWVALPDATECGFTILGKNSDRPLFDCQPLIFVPRQEWPAGSMVECERIAIPQVEETYAHLGSAPYWCYGYEEGINEFGVAIGNEGICTKVMAEDVAAAQAGKGPEPGFTGMDLIRFGLERGKTAREALEVITSLLEEYGQFGPGVPGSTRASDYENSFIIADANEAWVLETAGRRWIAKRFTTGTTAISNEPSIRTEWDLASPDLVEYAVKRGWWPKDRVDAFDFAWAYLDTSERGTSMRRSGHPRVMAARYLLEKEEGHITPRYMMRVARDHHEDTFLGEPWFDLQLSIIMTIDMWATCTSSVAILPNTPDELPVYWWGASIACNNCMVPFFPNGSKLPEIVSTTGTHGKTVEPPSKAEEDTFSSDSYWWLFRDLADKTAGKTAEDPIGYWNTRTKIVRAEFDALEKDFEAGVSKVVNKAVELRKAGKVDEAAEVLDDYSAKCVDKVLKKVNELRELFD